jgi:hypothetical protein
MTFLLLLSIAVATAIYLFPCLIACKRHTTNDFTIIIVNLLFGWTVIGWIIAFFMAMLSQTETAAEIERETLRRLRGGGDR